MVGIILENVEDKYMAWNLVFYIAIGVYIIGGIVFSIFATAETQGNFKFLTFKTFFFRFFYLLN